MFCCCYKKQSHLRNFFIFPVAKTTSLCYSEQGRREQLARRKSGVAVATGRVSLLKFKRRIQFRQVAEAVTPHLLSGGSFSSHEFRFGQRIVKNAARAKRLSRPAVGWVFSVQTGIVRLATQIFDNLVGRRSNVRQNFE